MLKIFPIVFSFLVLNSISFADVLYCYDNNQQESSANTNEPDNDENEDGIVLLSYNPNFSQSNIIQTSAQDESETDAKIEDEIKEVSCEAMMEKDFADMRMVQLASNIADDMGIVMSVSLNR